MAAHRTVGQAILAFLLLPGTIAFAIPVFVLGPDSAARSFDGWGFIPLTLGSILLLWCARDFYVAGKGTIAPWAPPRHLVVTGLYRVSRNPMYIAVTLVLWGWAVGFQSRSLATYAICVMVAFHLRIVFGEEPWLARAHGQEWERYKTQVPRWF